MRDTVQFSITGEHTIHCASCEARIERALRRVPGVQDVRANADTQQVAATRAVFAALAVPGDGVSLRPRHGDTAGDDSCRTRHRRKVLIPTPGRGTYSV